MYVHPVWQSPYLVCSSLGSTVQNRLFRQGSGGGHLFLGSIKKKRKRGWDINWSLIVLVHNFPPKSKQKEMNQCDSLNFLLDGQFFSLSHSYFGYLHGCFSFNSPGQQTLIFQVSVQLKPYGHFSLEHLKSAPFVVKYGVLYEQGFRAKKM